MFVRSWIDDDDKVASSARRTLSCSPFPPNFARAAERNVSKLRQCIFFSLLPTFNDNNLCAPVNMIYMGFTMKVGTFLPARQSKSSITVTQGTYAYMSTVTLRNRRLRPGCCTTRTTGAFSREALTGQVKHKLIPHPYHQITTITVNLTPTSLLQPSRIK